MIGLGQPNVNIPDANFKAYLVGNTAINTNGDAEIQLTEATAFNGAISCQNLNIDSLRGIEAFTALITLDCSGNYIHFLDVSQNTSLTDLDCHDNQLTSLDLTANTALWWLECQNNQLTSLDVSQNTALTYLDCSSHPLTSLDVSGATALTTLRCYSNQLTSLDVSQNTALYELNCKSNQLTSLDVSQNPTLYGLECRYNQLTSLDVRNGNNANMSLSSSVLNFKNNPQLYCIDVDDIQYSYNNWFNIDAQSYFSEDCSAK